MNKKLKKTVGTMTNNKTSLSQAQFPPMKLSQQEKGQRIIDFNKYQVVYSNNVSGNLHADWAPGATMVYCYKDEMWVGLILFYETSENFNGGYIDEQGRIIIEYPMACFKDVMYFLKTFSSLSLMIVEKDLQGTPLNHPLGAVMMNDSIPIGE